MEKKVIVSKNDKFLNPDEYFFPATRHSRLIIYENDNFMFTITAEIIACYYFKYKRNNHHRKNFTKYLQNTMEVKILVFHKLDEHLSTNKLLDLPNGLTY